VRARVRRLGRRAPPAPCPIQRPSCAFVAAGSARSRRQAARVQRSVQRSACPSLRPQPPQRARRARGS
jgi:hypothetical protein